MTNLPALLMALVLGGSSVASVVCIGVCEETLPTNCHQEIGISGEPAMIAFDGCGAPAYSVGPFVKEQRPPNGVLFFVTAYDVSLPTMPRGDGSAITSADVMESFRPRPVLRM